MTPSYSVRILEPIAAYLEATTGKDTLAAVCQAGELEVDSLLDPDLLVSWQQIEALLAAARAGLPSDDVFMAACSFSPPGAGAPLPLARHVLTPAALYRAAAPATWPIGSAGRFVCVEHGRGFARVRYASDHRESRLLCLWRQSRAIQAPTWWGLPPAMLREHGCIAEGEDACEYAISWYGRPRWTIDAIGGAAGVAALAALNLATSPIAWLLLPLGAAIGHAMEGWRNVRANRMRAAEFAAAFRASVTSAGPRLAASRNGRVHAAPDVPTAPAAAPSNEPPSAEFVRDGDVWRIVYAGTTILLRDSRGLSLIVHLLRAPGQEIHVATLDALTRGAGPMPAPAVAGAGEGEVVLGLGDAGEVLDAQAKAEYRRRLAELQQEQEDAEACNDPGRAARAREETEAIADELRSAVTPRGRERRAASHVERARVAITHRIRAAVAQIAKQHPDLGDHLSTSIHTGSFCCYRPASGAVTWRT